jgi:DNA-binding SARP family transcriptional activator
MPNDRSVQLLGRVVARAGSIEVSDFTTTHARNLLVYLAMHPDVDHPRDRLVQAIWPGRLDMSARNRLSVTLYHAKRAICEADPAFGEAFVSGRTTVRFDSEVAVVDLHVFRRCITTARTTKDTDEKRQNYAIAMGLYKGPLTPDVVTEWTLARQIEASQMFQEAAVWLASDLDSSGRNEEAQDVLSRALDMEPYSERATELLTTWYTRSGKYELAAMCAKRLRRALAAYGQAPSRAMLDRIDELNLVLADRSRAVVFADETVVTVLAFEGTGKDVFENIVREHGGGVSADGGYGLFANPLMAMEAGNKVLAAEPEAVGLAHSTVMGWHDPVPPAVPNGLAVLEERGLYGSEAFACLVRERSEGAVRKVSNKVWAVV